MIAIDCHKCPKLFRSTFRTAKNKHRNCAARVFIHCEIQNIPLSVEMPDGEINPFPTWLDFKLGRIRPHYNCQFLKAAREQGQLPDFETRIEMKRGELVKTRWNELIKYY